MNKTTTIAPSDRAEPISLEPHEIDCVVAVMLKVLDGKCKMDGAAKEVMTRLYDAVKAQPGRALPTDMHRVIAAARVGFDPQLREQIHQRRVLAESLIPRPVMKAFKARLRRDGILPV